MSPGQKLAQSNARKKRPDKGGLGEKDFHICGGHVNEMDKAKYGQMRMVNAP